MTPKGDCRNLYIADQSHSGFSIRESMNGDSDVVVDWFAIAPVVDATATEDVLVPSQAELDNLREIHEEQAASIR